MWGKVKPKNLFPEIELKSDRIIMRPPQMTDWPQWADARRKNKAHIQPFDPLWATNALDESFFERRIGRQSREWALGLANAFLILKREDCSLIGGMNINNICRGAAQFASLGYWVEKNHQGQGYMAEALQLTLRYVFEELELHRVNASCLLNNARSKKTLLNAGFEQEGTAEKYLKINGIWQDHELFGLPIERWKERV